MEMNIAELKELLPTLANTPPNRNIEELQAQTTFKETIKKEFVEFESSRKISSIVSVMNKSQTINGVLITGEGGVGKSTIVTSILKKEGVDFVYLNSYSTALKLFINCYNNRTKTIVLDDIESILQDKKGVSILKSLLWGNGNRLVTYETTTKMDIPTRYIFEGKIIILSNATLDDDIVMNSLKSRLICREISISFKEKVKLAGDIIKSNYPKLEDGDVEQIVAFIEEHTNKATKNLNFRTFIKVAEYYTSIPYSWRELAKEEFEVDSDKELVLRLMNGQKSVIDQVREFEALTGKGRRTYFRVKKWIK